MTDMKKLTFLTILLWIGGMAVAQVANNQEYKMMVGDTIVWKPFDNCDMMNLSRLGERVIDFKLTGKYYDRVKIIATKEGKCSMKATCGDTEALAQITVQVPYVAPVFEKMQKPVTQTFTKTYNFNPPANNFFVTIFNPESGCRETYVKVGDNEAYNDGQGLDRFWNIKTGANWYYRPEAQGWTDDVKWEFEPFGTSFFPLNAFANEVNTDNLSQYYVGMEKVLDVDCWKFFVDQPDGTAIQYWVDPSNGCTLKRQVNNDMPREVTVYDLKYTKLYFGPSFKKGLHDTTR